MLTTDTGVPIHLIRSADDLTRAHRAGLFDCVSAADTETEYDPTRGNTAVTADGIEYTTRLDVDGPGPLRVISLAGRDQRDDEFAIVIDVRDLNMVDVAEVLAGHEFAGWNAPFDNRVFTDAGIGRVAWRDLMLADLLLRCGKGGGDTFRYSLARAAQVYLGVSMSGKGTVQLSFNGVDDLSDEQVRYAADDAVLTARLDALFAAKMAAADLEASFRRNVAAQPFITSMTRNGMPMDVDAYRADVIDRAEQTVAEASATIGMLTGGAKLLTWVAAQTILGNLAADDDGDPTRLGREVLSDDTRWGALRAWLEGRIVELGTDIAVAAGGTVMAEDLFSAGGGPSVIPPFNPGNDTEVRRWLSKRAPLFAACIVAAAAHPEMSFQSLDRLAGENADEVLKASGGKTRLVAAHNLDEVLERLAVATAPDVDDDLRRVALLLIDYRAVSGFLADYGMKSAPVRIEPTWKVNNAAAGKDMFNTYFPDQVRAYFAKYEGRPRLFGPADQLGADTLKLVDGDLAKAMLQFRTAEKLVTTYGDKFLTYVHPVTGRLHSAYAQARTATGRLASSNPNGQNLAPVIKRYIRPDAGRVFACIDLSQAELRFLAAISGDANMIAAFGSGEDLHARTAGLMFSVDMAVLADLAAGGPGTGNGEEAVNARTMAAERAERTGTPLPEAAAKLRKELRQKAKRVSFGYAYGIGAAKLGHDLTVDGVETSTEEARELIGRFDVAYPQAAAWMRARAAFIAERADDITHGVTSFDWAGSWRTYRSWKAVKEARSVLGKTADAETVSVRIAPDEVLRTRLAGPDGDPDTVDADVLSAARAEHAAVVAAMDAIDVPLLHTGDGNEWMFTSRTPGGALRHFTVTAPDWEWGVVNAIVKSRHPAVRAAREAWVAERNAGELAAVETIRATGKAAKAPAPVVLSAKGRPLRGKELEKQFEDRTRRTSLVEYVAGAVGPQREYLFREGAADRVRAAGNQYRNHPIQAGVSDAVMDAMAAIWADLPDTAVAVQSVHDSIVIECDVADGEQVLNMCITHMEAALAAHAPGVVVKADGDLQATLDDSSKLDLAALAA